MVTKKIFIPILILVVLAVMIYGLLQGQKTVNQEPALIIKPVKIEPPAAPKPPPPGETHATGHWHGDEWHSEPHETHPPPAEVHQPPPSPESAAEETPDALQAPPQLPADFVNPTSTSSNPLFADGVPEHLQCPPEFIGVYVRDISAEALERTYQVGFELIEKWNPNRPLTEVWDAFMEAERWYYDNADPERVGISMGAGRSDWQWQSLLDFPEIGVLGLEDTDRFFNMRMVELGIYDPDFNLGRTTLADGRVFMFREDVDKKYVYTYPNGGMTTSGPSNGDPNAEVIHINLDEVTDEELERLSGWNYNINPYTTGAYKLGDNQ